MGILIDAKGIDEEGEDREIRQFLSALTYDELGLDGPPQQFMSFKGQLNINYRRVKK